MNIITTALISLDLSWVQDQIRQNESTGYSSLTRALVLASQAGRMTRLLRVMNLVGLFRVRATPHCPSETLAPDILRGSPCSDAIMHLAQPQTCCRIATKFQSQHLSVAGGGHINYCTGHLASCSQALRRESEGPQQSDEHSRHALQVACKNAGLLMGRKRAKDSWGADSTAIGRQLAELNTLQVLNLNSQFPPHRDHGNGLM